MRTVLTAIIVFTAIAHAEWVTLSEQDFAATWKAASGNWTGADGAISGVAPADGAAVLLSTADYFDFELEVDFKTDVSAVGAIAVRAHWLPDAPHAGQPLPLFGVTWPVDTVHPERTGVPAELHVEATSTPPAINATDWNTLRISAKGDTQEVFVNGTKILTHASREFIGGKIALVVDPGATIQFRNIRINDLGRDGEWRSLFNGIDFRSDYAPSMLAGWKIWGSEEWKVEDGIIIGRSGPKKSEGYLATEETFKDFRVRGTFKMLGEGNFGLFYHSTIAYNDEQYPVISGLQGEVAPGYPSPSGWVYESYKRGWLVEPDMTTYRAFALRPNEWSEIEIESQGNHITTWVNGIQVLDLVDDKQLLTEGSFALQLHTGGTDGIQWKDLYVKR